MTIVKFIILFLFIASTSALPQFSVDNFLNEPLSHSFSSLKDSLSNKTIEEKIVMNYKALLYYDRFEPFSIKVGYLFDEKGKQIGKSITNGKEKDEVALNLFKTLKENLIIKFGGNYSENSMLGLTILIWKGIENLNIMLTQKDDNTMLTIIRNK